MTQVNLTIAQLEKMCKGKLTAASRSNMNSLYTALKKFGPQLGLLEAQILPHFLCQQMHESGSFRYDREIWGPTAQQRKYDPPTKLAKTLGNTSKGDGKLYMGRTGGQITGKGNYARFTKFAKRMDPNAPDFVKNPNAINTDPWEGLGPIWYWSEGNPEGTSLNKYAKDNNIEMVTLRINGGKNGLGDRMDYYVRAALVLLGYGPTDVLKFQKDRKMDDQDGIAGAMTRQELHLALGGKNPFKEVVKVEKPKAVPVPQAVVPQEVEKPWYKSPEQLITTVTGPAGLTLFGWVNDIAWEKMLILLGIALIVVLGFFLIKRRAKTQVATQVTTIEADAEITRQDIRDQRADAEATYKAIKEA